MKPRDYQTKGFDLIIKKFLQGKTKVLYVSPTGSGKSYSFEQIINRAVAKGNRCLLAVYGKDLVLQAAAKFKDPSIIMSGHKMDTENPVQIASISTVKSRKPDFLKGFEIVIIDEAHNFCQNSYQEYIESLDAKFYIGFTATPYAVGKKGHMFWDDFVKPITPLELNQQDYLVTPEIWSAKNEIETKGIKIVKGDFDKKELQKRASESKVVGDIISNYKEKGKNLPAICFAINVSHANFLKEKFHEAGITAEVMTGETSMDDRDYIIRRLREGSLKIAINIGTLTTGSDIPEAVVGIMARPTQSENLYIQMIGRILRPCRFCGDCGRQYDNSEKCYHCGGSNPTYIKEKAIILDHGGNVNRHGHPFLDREPVMENIDTKAKKAREEDLENQSAKCDECYFVYSIDEKKCPQCGHENQKRKDRIIAEKGDLFLYSDEFLYDRNNELNRIHEDYLRYKANAERQVKIQNPYYSFEQIFKKLNNKELFSMFMNAYYPKTNNKKYTKYKDFGDWIHGRLEKRKVRKASKSPKRNNLKSSNNVP